MGQRIKKITALVLAFFILSQVLPLQVYADMFYSDGLTLQDQIEMAPMATDPVYHTVYFNDWDGTQLKAYDGTANPLVLDGTRLQDIQPPAPTRVGFTFLNWTPPESYITGDSPQTYTFTAQYRSTNLYDLNIKYVYANGSQAALAHTATYIYGDSYSVASPEIVGYVADSSSIDGTAGTSLAGATALNYIVTYVASTGTPYKVEHYFQNIADDNYTIDAGMTENLTATTGATVSVSSQTVFGFTAKTATQNVVIAADGTTVVKLYYDRNSYIINYDTDGGNYIAPFQGRYGAAVPAVSDPTRSGYTFAGWDGTIPTTLTQSINFTASWTALSNVPYTLVYWIENADPNPGTDVYGYTFHSTANRSGTAGQLAVLSTDDQKYIQYFTYDHYDNATPIAGDGSTKINVYYTRNSYKIEFDLDRSNATLTIAGVTYTNGGTRYSFTAKYSSDISAKWPTASNVPPVTSSSWPYATNYFVGWTRPGINSTYASARINLTPDLFLTSGTTVYSAEWRTNTTSYDLHYMLESLDGTGIPYNGINYQQDAGLSGVVNAAQNSSWSAKNLAGFDNVGTERDGAPGTDGDIDVYFYYTRNSYNLSFYNHNSIVTGKTQTIKFGALIPTNANFNPDLPSDLPGYTFGGWYTTPDAVPGTAFVWSSARLPANNIMLYAKWNPPTHAVRFTYTTPTGELVLHDTQQVTQGLKATRPTDPASIPGYTFDAWYYSGTLTRYVFDAQVFNNLDLTGRYLPLNDRTYTVKYLDATTYEVRAPQKTVTDQTTGTTVTENAVQVSGYIPDSRTKDLVIAADNNEIIFYYKALPVDYTVQYLERGTNLVLREPVTKESQSVTVTETALVIEDYEYTMLDGNTVIVNFTPDQASKTIDLTSDPSQNIITFYYEKIIKNHYYVRYLEVGSETVLATEKYVITAKNNVVEYPKAIANYVSASYKSTYPSPEYNVAGNNNYISSQLYVIDPDSDNPQIFTFYYVPIYIEISGVKTWVDNGNVLTLRPAITDLSLTIYGNNDALNPQPIPRWTDNGNNTWTYSYINLPAAANNEGINYTITETVPALYTAKHRDKAAPGGTDITNTLNGGTTAFSGIKTWIDSIDPDSGFDPRPTTLQLTLYKSVNGSTPQALNPQPTATWVKDGDQWTYTYTDLVKYENGYPIVYSAAETVPSGYEQTADDGQNFTNKVIETTATKIWQKGPATKPTVWFKAYRQVEGGSVEEVPNASIKELTSGTTSVTWRGFAQEDSNGNPYTFSVREVDAAGNALTLQNYTKTEVGLTVTNTYVIPKNGKTTVTKKWVNGTSTHPELWLQLWRKTTTASGEVREAVPGLIPIKANTLGDTSHEWTGLDETDIDGNPYTFFAKEGQWNGTTFTEGVPSQYALSPTTDSLDLINTYTIPTDREVTATKKWTDGPSTKPTVWFKLQRRIENGAWQDVPGAEIKELTNGVLSVTWTGLERTDASAKAYDFSVIEGTYAGTTFTAGSPSNYPQNPSTLNTLAIENIYKSPLRDNITTVKHWDLNGVDDDSLKTPVTIQLWRKAGTTAEPELVSEKELNGEIDAVGELTPWSYEFSNLDETDSNGVTYIYYVQEKTVPANFVDSVLGYEITNTWQIQSFSVRKTWSGGYAGQVRPAVTLQLQRSVNSGTPVNYLLPVELDGTTDGIAGETSGEHTAWTYTWEKLPQHDSNGNKYSYSFTETRLIGYTPSNPVDDNGVQVINNHYEHVTVDATKVIIIPEGATAPAEYPDFSFKLLRNGNHVEDVTLNGIADTADGTDIDLLKADGSGETAPGTDAGGNVTRHYTWTNLPAKDANGNPFVYTVTEPNIPSGYVRSSVNGNMTDGFTISNTYRSDTFRAFKYWNTKAGTPPVTFKLIQVQITDAGLEVPNSALDMSMNVVLNGIADNLEDPQPNQPTYYEEEAWQAVWTGLPTTRDGQTVKYYVEELAIPDFDIMSSASTVITNKSMTTDVTVAKQWLDGDTLIRPAVTLTLERYRYDGTTLDNEFTAMEAVLNGVADENGELSPSADGQTWNYQFTNLTRFYDDTTSEPSVQREYVYKISEKTAHVPEKYVLEDIKVINGVQTVSNRYQAPTINYLAKKVWDGGKSSPVTLRLYRKTEAMTEAEPVGPGFTINGVTDTDWVNDTMESEPWVITRRNLPLTDTQGNAYVYTVVETTSLENFAAPTYAYNQVINGQTYHAVVSNRYIIPTNGFKTATKTWVNGSATHPDLWLQLWRKTTTGSGDIYEAVPGAEIVKANTSGNTSHTWENLATTDGAANPYTFFIKEGQLIGETFTVKTPDHYVLSPSADSLDLTNTYEIPKDAELTATKTWTNGPTGKPTVWFKLYRRTVIGETYGEWSEVPGVEVKQVPTGQPPLSLTWSNLESTDTSANPYEYAAVEGILAGTSFTPGAPSNYSVNGQFSKAIENVYVPPKDGTFAATKTWAGGPPVNQTAVPLTLYRESVNIPREEVPNPPTYVVSGSSPSFTYTWNNLESKDFKGADYTFTVKETAENSDQEVLVNGSTYKVTYDSERKAVTNTYVIPKDKTEVAIKTWENGASPRQTIWFKLQRRISSTPGWSDVLDAEIKELSDGTVSAKWTGLERTDGNGNPYLFSVVEGQMVNGNFSPGAPANYSVSGQNSLSLKNSYSIPKDTIVASKEWQKGPTAKPTVYLQLWRSLEASGELAAVDEAVPGLLPVELVNGAGNASWQDVELTDINARDYAFRVIEGTMQEGVFEPGLPESFEYEVSYGNDQLSLINTYKSPTTTKTAIKKWAGNGPTPYPQIWFRLERRTSATQPWTAVPNAPVTEVETEIGASVSNEVSWPNIDLKDESGIPYFFRVAEGSYAGGVFTSSVPSNYAKLETENSVTNTWLTVSKTASKKWAGAPSQAYELPAPEVTLTLSSYTTDATVLTKVDEVTLNGNESPAWSKTWSELPKFDSNNLELNYVVEESNLPKSYTSKVENIGSDWLITNTFEHTSVEVYKVYQNTSERPPVTIVLFQNGHEFDRYRLDGVADSPVQGEPYEYAPGRIIWPNLPKTTLDGSPAVYTVSEEIPENFPYQRVISPMVSETADIGFRITNTYNEGTLLALKNWNLGASPAAASVTFTLHRWVSGSGATTREAMGADFNGVMNGTTDTSEGLHGSETAPWRYTWKNLPLNGNRDGDPAKPVYYTYFVEELDLGAGFEVDVNSSASLKITNVALKTEFSAEKLWGGGPAPQIYFQLSRTENGDAATKEPVGVPVLLKGTVDPVGATESGELEAWRYTWKNLERFADDAHTIPYIYSASEVDASGNVVAPTDYTAYGNDSNRIINVYTQDVTASKEWIGGEAQRTAGIGPDVYLTLYRQTINQEEPVALLDNELNNNEKATRPLGTATSLTWSDLPQATEGGALYTYSVVETDSTGERIDLWEDTSTSPQYIYRVEYDESNPLKVTNRFDSPVKDIEVTKNWYGVPEGQEIPPISVRLYRGLEADPASHTPIEELAYIDLPLTASDTPNTAIWKNQDMFNESGAGYYYSVREFVKNADTYTEGAPEGYLRLGSGLSLNNVYLIDVPVSKVWLDEEGKPMTDAANLPESLAIKLTGSDGSTYNETLQGSEIANENWKHVFTDLPSTLEDGTPIIYAISETEPLGYKQNATSGNQTTGFILTNQYTGEDADGNLLSVDVSKTWLDLAGEVISDATNLPASLAVELSGSDGESYTASLSSAGEWQHTFADVFAIDKKSQPITYTLSETVPLGYEQLAQSGNQTDGFVLTNQYNGKDADGNLLSVDVAKIWLDEHGLAMTDAEMLPASLDVVLSGTDGSSHNMTLTADLDWVHTFTELFAVDTKSQAIRYSITETAPLGYKQNPSSGNQADGFVLTNQYDGKDAEGNLRSVAVAKTWLDDTGVEISDDSKLPTSLAVTLKGTDGKAYTENLSATADWQHTFTELFAVDTKSQPINYAVEESVPLGYRQKETSGNQTTGFMLTNQYTGEDAEGNLLSVDVSKTWLDATGLALTDASKLPESLDIVLHGSDGESYTATLSAEVAWRHGFNSLFAIDMASRPISYMVTEAKPIGYKQNATTGNQANGFVLTNQYNGHDSDDNLLSVKVTKIWLDEAGKPITDVSKLPKNLSISLNGTDDSSYTAVMTPTADGQWTYTYEGVYATDSQSQPITYTVEETVPLGYEQNESTGTQNTGFVLTNRYTGKDADGNLTAVDVSKTWLDEAGLEIVDAAQLPESLAVALIGSDAKRYPADLTATAEWRQHFANLFAVDMASRPITYEVTETVPLGYKQNLTSGTQAEGFVLNNQYTGKDADGNLLSVKVAKTWLDENGLKMSDAANLPKDLAISLSGSDGHVYEASLAADSNWQHLFVDMHAIDTKTQVVSYKVSEIVPLGYKQNATTGNQTVGFMLTNQYTGEDADGKLTSVDVAKVWLDGQGKVLSDASRLPASLALALQDSDGNSYEQQLTAAEKWTHTFTDVYAVDKKSQPMNYSVTETKPLGYKQTALTGNQADGFVLTNQYTGEDGQGQLRTIKVSKRWLDGNGQAITELSLLPAVLNVELQGSDKQNYPYALLAKEGWQHVYGNLPAYDTKSEPVTYTLSETVANGFEQVDVSGNEQEGFVLTNKLAGTVPAEDFTLIIKKFLYDANGNAVQDPQNFKVIVSGPSFPRGQTVSVFTYQDAVLTGLLGGTYSVELAAGEGSGYTVSISDPVSLSSANPEDTIIITGRQQLATTTTSTTKAGTAATSVPRTGERADDWALATFLMFLGGGLLLLQKRTAKGKKKN